MAAEKDPDVQGEDPSAYTGHLDSESLGGSIKPAGFCGGYQVRRTDWPTCMVLDWRTDSQLGHGASSRAAESRRLAPCGRYENRGTGHFETESRTAGKEHRVVQALQRCLWDSRATAVPRAAPSPVGRSASCCLDGESRGTIHYKPGIRLQAGNHSQHPKVVATKFRALMSISEGCAFGNIRSAKLWVKHLHAGCGHRTRFLIPQTPVELAGKLQPGKASQEGSV